MPCLLKNVISLIKDSVLYSKQNSKLANLMVQLNTATGKAVQSYGNQHDRNDEQGEHGDSVNVMSIR